MKNHINSHISSIKNIPLFANITEDELQEILENSQIKSFEKDEIFFSQNQKIINFYIVLSGSLKICVRDSVGEEAIIQIINQGKFIGDIFSKFFTTDAQIIKNSVILFLPAEQFKKSVEKNVRLANNLLSHIFAQNKVALDQITQLKLGNAKQKLGQFLLKTAFEKGQRAKNFILQYEKSTLASLLGMRSETLSRTFKKLKSDGDISIKKNKIFLPNDTSLCAYCNSEIAEKCCGSAFCERC